MVVVASTAGKTIGICFPYVSTIPSLHTSFLMYLSTVGTFFFLLIHFISRGISFLDENHVRDYENSSFGVQRQ